MPMGRSSSGTSFLRMRSQVAIAERESVQPSFSSPTGRVVTNRKASFHVGFASR